MIAVDRHPLDTCAPWYLEEAAAWKIIIDQGCIICWIPCLLWKLLKSCVHHIVHLILIFSHLHTLRVVSVIRYGQDESMQLLWMWWTEDVRGWESPTVRLSCGRLSLSFAPLGLISSACLQREGDLQGLIITQATTLLQRCSLHWTNPRQAHPLLWKWEAPHTSKECLCVHLYTYVCIFIPNPALNPFPCFQTGLINASGVKTSILTWSNSLINMLICLTDDSMPC